MTKTTSVDYVSPHRDLSTVAGHPPLDIAIAAWLDAKAKRTGSAKTATAYAATIAAFRALLRDHGLDLDGDPALVALVAQGWASHGDPAPATFNQKLAILSSFYSYALRRDLLIGSNPIGRVDRRPVQGYAGAIPLPYLEVKARLAAIDRTALIGKRDYALLVVGLQTGRRLSELAGVRFGDMSVSGERLTVIWRRCKGGKTMSDTLPAAVTRAVGEYLHALYGDTQLKEGLPPDAPVWASFARNGSNGRALGIQSVADICAKRLGTSKVHALRHTFARAMEDAGAKVSEIQSRLGHDSLATTGRYLAALHRADNPHADRLVTLFGLDSYSEA
ncbi:MAG: tyrosine-type recombinase/integrase [Chloroflexota bacterium]|nr:tyrosine-type recombinase/integrase [Chloroflexota bacterium]